MSSFFHLTDDHEIDAFYKTDTDRSVAIVLGQIVENRLTDAMRSHMRQDDSSVKSANELFRSSGALGNFGAKIELAHLIGMIPTSLYHDLRYVRRIRNEFAHNLSVKDFEHQRVKSWVENLNSFSIWTDLQKSLPDGDLKKEVLEGELSTMRDAYRLCIRFYILKLMQLEHEEPKSWHLILMNFPHSTDPTP